AGPRPPAATATRTRSAAPAKCFAAVSATCVAVEKWMNPSRRSTAAPANVPDRSASRQSVLSQILYMVAVTVAPLDRQFRIVPGVATFNRPKGGQSKRLPTSYMLARVAGRCKVAVIIPTPWIKVRRDDGQEAGDQADDAHAFPDLDGA